jgi:hypothetical protein
MHLKAMKHAIPCHTYPDLSTLLDCVDSTKMKDHLALVHVIIVKENTKRKRKNEDGVEDDHEVDVVA